MAEVINRLFVLENDIGSVFLLLENCLRDAESPLLCAGQGAAAADLHS